MKVTLLGTGTSMGVPMIACDCKVCKSKDPRDKRLRSSVKIEMGNHVIVVDAGPDFRQQMLASQTKKLDAILFTHEHKDHTAGLDDVRAFNWINRQAVNLYGEEPTLNALKNEFSYAFKAMDEKYPGAPELVLNKIERRPFPLFGEEILPIRVYHHKMPVLGFRIRNFSYITDASYIPDESIEKLKGSKVLVINGLRIKNHISHFNLEQALVMIEQINPEKAYITHMSHNIGLHAETSEKLPPNVFLGQDGLEIDL
ncbi:MBL fold metallo-hydrolase [Marinilabilia rubra]|uniref:MBL fold metallo-hydrolase n=1 Tax=Marinilabilia rubra TaxID=2162893 RepID=A0A2U2B5M2_9BACT|nr:MBL fold metallo-hydrolase [Marinilabilia rubra]PWD98334.1 MBL fold metallo-hydrolase [Marinilabilia rubra]